MRITYTAPNRAWHYTYAEWLNEIGALHAFVCGFPRWSVRAVSHNVGDKLIRKDFWQTLYLGALRLKMPESVCHFLNRYSHAALDRASFKAASQSDIFLYYRTTGTFTARRVKHLGVACVMEEVNSHVAQCHGLMQEEAKMLGISFLVDRRADLQRQQSYCEADYILVPSDYVRRSFIARGVPEHKLLKVPFGFDLPADAVRREEVGMGRFRILYVGQIHFRKGLHYLLEAFSQLRVADKELWLVGPLTATPGIDVDNLPEGASWRGVLKGDALSHAYNQSDVFVLPSIDEGLALVLGEALAHGLPIVATDHTGAEEILEDQVEGKFIPIRSAPAIRSALQELADDRRLLRLMSRSAVQKANSLRGWEVCKGALLSALKQASKGKMDRDYTQC